MPAKSSHTIARPDVPFEDDERTVAPASRTDENLIPSHRGPRPAGSLIATELALLDQKSAHRSLAIVVEKRL